MIRSEHVYIPRVDGHHARILLPGKNPRCIYSLNELRNYRYTHWAGGDGRYYISTGWNQGVGRVDTLAEAEEYCQFARDHMHFSGVVIAEGLTFEVGTECSILDLDRHWDSDCRLSYHGCQFWAGRGQWRFKVVWDQLLTV
jgi:hypothetical protein